MTPIRPAETRSWLRTNLVPLIVVAVLATASIWYTFIFDWVRYQNGNPTQILDVPTGKQAAYGGGTFYLEEMTVLAGDSPEGSQYGVLEGTDVVVADLHVIPIEGGDPEGFVQCELRLLAPSPDGQREWWPESNPTSYPNGDEDVFSCNIAGGPEYTYREFFVVPAGGAEDAVVQVTLQEELPLTLHLH